MKYYKTNEALKLLGISKPTILRYMKKGELPYTGHGGRGGYFIKAADLKLFAKTRGIDLDGLLDDDAVVSKNEKDVLALELEENHILQEKAKYKIELFALKEDKENELKARIELCDLALEEVKIKEAML